MSWEAQKSPFPDLYPVERGWLVVETGDNESPLSSRLVATYVSKKNAKLIAGMADKLAEVRSFLRALAESIPDELPALKSEVRARVAELESK